MIRQKFLVTRRDDRGCWQVYGTPWMATGPLRLLMMEGGSPLAEGDHKTQEAVDRACLFLIDVPTACAVELNGPLRVCRAQNGTERGLR